MTGSAESRYCRWAVGQAAVRIELLLFESPRFRNVDRGWPCHAGLPENVQSAAALAFVHGPRPLVVVVYVLVRKERRCGRHGVNILVGNYVPLLRVRDRAAILHNLTARTYPLTHTPSIGHPCTRWRAQGSEARRSRTRLMGCLASVTCNQTRLVSSSGEDGVSGSAGRPGVGLARLSFCETSARRGSGRWPGAGSGGSAYVGRSALAAAQHLRSLVERRTLGRRTGGSGLTSRPVCRAPSGVGGNFASTATVGLPQRIMTGGRSACVAMRC